MNYQLLLTNAKEQLQHTFYSIRPIDVLFTFCLLLGKIPFWVMLLALVAYRPANPMGIICLFGSATIARGFLLAYEYQISFARGTLRSFVRHMLRPMGMVILYIMAFVSIIYLPYGNANDWMLGFAIAGCFIISFAANILVKPKIIKRTAPITPRSIGIKITIFCLWLYFLLQPDGLFMMLLSLILIYTLEFISTYSINDRRKFLNG